MSQDDNSSPRTVIRPRSGGSRRADPALFADLARPVLALAEGIARDPAPNANRWLTEARDALDAFESEALRRGLSQTTIAPARYALLVILDTAARANRAMPLKTWSAGAMAALFRGRDTNIAGLRKLHDQGQAAGPDYADVTEFLKICIERIDSTRTFRPEKKKSKAGMWLLLGSLAVVAGFALWVGWAEWRFRNDLLAGLALAEDQIATGGTSQITGFATQLDQLEGVVRDVETKAPDSPFGLIHRLGPLDPGRAARGRYVAIVNTRLPPLLADALNVSVASEGSDLALYDTIRARAILNGQSDWNPVFLSGWLLERDQLIPGLAGLARHARALSGPVAGLTEPDPELLAQAFQFAALAPEIDRAFLELQRSEAADQIAPWIPGQAIPHFDQIFLRRSGIPASQGVPGLFTAAGWDHAASSGAALALQEARLEFMRLFPDAAVPEPASPDAVLGMLQKRTIATWRDFLSDIRVRPFADQPSSVLISGALGVPDSPLEKLLREVWFQTGGTDRKRSYPDQLAIATEFGTTIQFVEQGEMTEISHLFGSLNVALASLGRDEKVGAQRLMNVQARANSITALRQAPVLVVQIVEDVLAQTSLSNEDLLKNQVNLLWQSQLQATCGLSMQTSFPFADGPDMAGAEFAALIGPGGSLDRFFSQQLARLIDDTGTPWRWKPEARFAGFSPASAEFFQRVSAIRQGYFGTSSQPSANLTLTALAERGTATVTLGGTSAPVETSGTPVTLQWPGPQPESGIGITFDAGSGPQTQQSPGLWGMLHILDGLRLRERDEGQRFLIDLRAADARLFVEMAFDSPDNPLSRRSLLKGLTCPPAL